MSQSITITGPDAAQPADGDLAGQIAARATTSHGMSAVDVRKPEQTHAAQTDAPLAGAKPGDTQPDIPARGGTIQTSKGPAPIIRTMAGEVVIDVPGLGQISMEQAKQHGLIMDGEQVTPKADDAPEGQDAPKTSGVLSGDTEGAAQVESDWSQGINAIEATISGLGHDAGQIMSDVLAAQSTGAALPDGHPYFAIEQHMGEDAMDQLFAKGEAFATHVVADAINAAGVTLTEAQINAAVASNPKAMVAAMSGSTQALKTLIATAGRK